MNGKPEQPAGFKQASARILAVAVPLAALGAWPTWKQAGMPGLEAEAAAVAIVVVVSLVAMACVVRRGRLGKGQLAVAFVLSGMAKAIAAAAMAAGASALLGLSFQVMALWVCLCYVAVMAALCVWIVKVLRM